LPPRDLRPEAAEGLGVLLLVLVGGAAAHSGAALGILGTAIAFAAVVALLVHVLGPVSGAHLNPAITLAFAVTGHFPWRRVPGYVAAQAAGAVGASLLLLGAVGSVAAATTRLQPGVTPLQGLAVEATATFLLAFVIVAVATGRRAAPHVAGMAIGLAVGVGALVAGPLTGGSMNPARSLGPALVAGDLGHAWLYVVAPVLGAAAAMAAYGLLRGGSPPQAQRRQAGTPAPAPLPQEP
jgi:MIP family channel proteins